MQPADQIPTLPRTNQRAFLVLMLVVLVLSFLLLRPYLSMIFLAFITALAFKPVYRSLLRLMRGYVAPAVGVTVILIYFTILIPLSLFINFAIHEAFKLSKDLNNLVSGRIVSVDVLVKNINHYLGQLPGIEYQITKTQVATALEDVARPIGNFLLEKAVALGSSTPELITRTFLFTIILVAFIPHTDKFISYLKRLSPLDDQLDDLYLRRILAMTSSMIKGSFIVATLQSLIGTIILSWAGVNYLFVLFILMILFGVLPVVGSATIMVPIGVYLLLAGNIFTGLVVIFTAIVVISNLDNVLRPMLVSKEAMINPALILLGVFGGIAKFGILGAVYGPVLMIILITTLEIYTLHYSAPSKRKLKPKKL